MKHAVHVCLWLLFRLLLLGFLHYLTYSNLVCLVDVACFLEDLVEMELVQVVVQAMKFGLTLEVEHPEILMEAECLEEAGIPVVGLHQAEVGLPEQVGHPA